MNKFLAVMVWVTGYIGASRILWFFVPRDLPVGSWSGFWLVMLLWAAIFLPIWMPVLEAGIRLWKLEVAK